MSANLFSSQDPLVVAISNAHRMPEEPCVEHLLQSIQLSETQKKRIADQATVGTTVRVPPVLFQPMAADDVAKAVSRVAVGTPVNGTVEVAGPQQFRFDELIRQGLAAYNDPREVVADPHARYFGAELSERSLIPWGDARLADIRFDEWLGQSVLQQR